MLVNQVTNQIIFTVKNWVGLVRERIPISDNIHMQTLVY